MTEPTDWGQVADGHKYLVRAMAEFPEQNWHDATSESQMRSKVWLLDKLHDLQTAFGNVLVVGGWLGFLTLMLMHRASSRCDRVVSLDLDPRACAAAQALLRPYVMDNLRAFSVCGDASTFDYQATEITYRKEDSSSVTFPYTPKTIINTSWEHMTDPAGWFEMIPNGRLVCVQANTNPNAEGHISCPDDLAELCALTPFRQRLYASERSFGESHRLMTFGYK